MNPFCGLFNGLQTILKDVIDDIGKALKRLIYETPGISFAISLCRQVIATIPVGNGLNGITVDSIDGKIYVTNTFSKQYI